jgi:hypothetical protein
MWTCILAVALQLPGLAFLDGISQLTAAFPAFFSLAAACLVYIIMAGALATRLKANGVSAVVCAFVLAGFITPVGFLAPDMRVFWLEEGSGAMLMPAMAGVALAVLWSIAGCVSLERRELE